MTVTAPRQITDPILPDGCVDLRCVLRDAPSVACLVAVDESGRVATVGGGEASADAGAAISRLWTAACRAAANRSPSPLDHLVLRTTIGDAVVVRARGWLLAAVGRRGTRPDHVAYELRRALDRHTSGPGSAAADQKGDAAAAHGRGDGADRKDAR